MLHTWAVGLKFGFFYVFGYRDCKTRFTCNNFGFLSLLPAIAIGFFEFGFFGFGFGFFGFGFRVSGNLPSHRYTHIYDVFCVWLAGPNILDTLMNKTRLQFMVGDTSKIRNSDECDFFVALLHSEIQHLRYDLVPFFLLPRFVLPYATII